MPLASHSMQKPTGESCPFRDPAISPAAYPCCRQQYQREAAKLLKPGGLLVITSCNSTQDELVKEFTVAQKDRSALGFTYLDHVKTYPCFVFGGITGTKVCTVAFRRRH